MRKPEIKKLTDLSLLVQRQSLGRQAGRQMNRQVGKDYRASENGKLPALHNQLGTFDQPEPRHQLLWDNRQPSEAWRAAGTVGTTGQWPAGKGLVNRPHRAKSRWWPSLKCCMKAAKQTSCTAKPLFPSCRLSTVALSQTRHPLSADRLVVEDGAMEWSLWTCYCTCFFHALSPCFCSDTYATYVEQMCTHTLLRHLSLELGGKTKSCSAQGGTSCTVMQHTGNTFLASLLADNW